MDQWIYHFAQEVDPNAANQESPKDTNRTIYIIPDSKLEWLNKKIESLIELPHPQGVGIPTSTK